jgi:hypothetical protein
MKRALLVLFLSICSLLSYAPDFGKILYLPMPTPINKIINYYDPLIDAIFKYESNYNELAYNEKENAVGGLQIRQCRIDHYNQLSGKKYTLNDMYDFNKAKEVFLLFAKGKTFEQAAKDWNGHGPMTEIYWNEVRQLL